MTTSSLFPARPAGWWRCLRPFVALGLNLLLAACAYQGYQYPSGSPQSQPPSSRPSVQPPVQTPKQPSQTIKPLPSAPRSSRPQQTRSGNHPRYAPPPDVAAYWDNTLGVYVVKGQSLFYRQRLYYRWSNGWYSAGRPSGPWEAIDGVRVPPGLRSRYPAR